MEDIIEKLSPIERKIIPYLDSDIDEIVSKSGLDRISVVRALKFLEAKNLVKIDYDRRQLADLGVNGIYYRKNHLPERKLLILLSTKNHLSLEDAKKLSKLSDNEFKVSLGILKRKALINLANKKLSLAASKEEIIKKFPEEKLIEVLPKEISNLTDEERLALENLKSRKDIVELTEKKDISFSLTESGKKIAGKKIAADLIEEVTPELIKLGVKNKKFRRYDLNAHVPRIYGGKKHFVNQSIDNAKKIWIDLGFKEMEGSLTETSFWNFDALFTAQDHPVRDMHDTFFIKKANGKLPSGEIVEKVKKAHQSGVDNSKGWRYNWDEDEARKVLLRTHTTCLSARTLSKLKPEDLPAKYFAIGKVFRNETLDWSHGFEFNQSEGIVIDPNANFRHLIGYLKKFAEKMGYTKIRIQPAYFPYTEPSVEGAVWNEERQEWVEMLAAGIFRPEVTVPLLGTALPVLAWGPGFDRLMMKAHGIKDLRELYKNDLNDLRKKKVIIK